jgi:hypothetical protein
LRAKYTPGATGPKLAVRSDSNRNVAQCISVCTP